MPTQSGADVVLYVLMLCAFAVTTAELVVVGVLPEIASDLAVSEPVAGLLVTAYGIGVAVGGPLLVLLTRRISRRTLLIATMAVAAAAATLSAAAPDYGLLIVGRVLGALAQALFLAVAVEVASASVSPDKQTAAISKVVVGFAIATVVGVPLGSYLGQSLGWRYAFVFIAAMCAAGLLGTIFGCPRISHQPDVGMLRTIATLGRPPILLGMLTLFLVIGGVLAAFTYVVPALTEVTGISAGAASIMLVVYGLGTVLGSTVAGRVPVGGLGLALPLVVAATLVVLATHGLLLHNVVTAAVSMFLLGCVAFGIEPLMVTWVMIQAGPGAGLAAAVNTSVFALAAGLGPVLGGLVFTYQLGMDMLGPLGAVPVLLGVLAIMASVMLTRRFPPVPTPDEAADLVTSDSR